MIALVIAAFSMIGIPPTVGFFSKLYLLLGAVEAKGWFFVAALLISVVLNIVYFFNVIKRAFFEPSEPAHAHNKRVRRGTGIAIDEAPLSMLVPIWIMAIAIVLLGIFSGKIITAVLEYAVPIGL